MILMLALILAGSSACHPTNKQSNHASNDGFAIGSLAESKIDSQLVNKAVDEINLGKHDEVHSMIIFKDNKIVFEKYFPGHTYKWDGPNFHGELMSWDKSTLHGAKSVSKSITSLCVGIAIDKGFIKNVNQSIFDYLPDHQQLKLNGKEKITIEHLLTMTSGLEWVEWGPSLSSEKNDIVGIWFQDKDPLTFILQKPLKHEPGTTFNYSGGNTIVLAEIIRNATKMDLAKFSERYLFKPLGIDSTDWNLRFTNGVIEAGGGLEITPRAMTKIGELCLNNGTFRGKKIISEQWIEKCFTQYANNKNIYIPGHASGSHGYSYSWWLKTYKKSGKEINMFHAVGWGGQEIVIIPQLNTVVVFTGGNYTKFATTFSLIDKYILPAIQ
jgi:CubicO group peptidase (beta-lactamase class C family)